MAYGARLESVLGASPRGFESPILRRKIRPFTMSGRFSFLGGVLGASRSTRGVRIPHSPLIYSAKCPVIS